MPVQIGLKDLYYALLTSPDTDDSLYSAPVKIADAINAKISPKINVENIWADDGISETLTEFEIVDVELETKDISMATHAVLLGHSIIGGIEIDNKDDAPPYVAIGFRSKKSNKKYRYIWLLKGKFSEPDQDYNTQEGKPKPQTAKIKGTFVARDSDGNWRRRTDEDHPDYVASIGTNWFNAVEAAADVTAPTVTVSPVDAAAGVAVGANVVWTFSEAIQASDVVAANFFVVKASDGTAVPGALSIDVDHKIVTLNPTSNLDAATAYIAFATTNIEDLAGNALAANSITNFTTA